MCSSDLLGELKPTAITLQLADRSLRRPLGILEDIPTTVGKFAYPVDFIVLDMSDKSEAIILGRPFLATAGALIDVKGAKLTLRFGGEEVMFDMKHPTHTPYSQDTCMRTDTTHSCVEDIFTDKSRQTVEPTEEEGCHFAIYQIAYDKGCNGKELDSHMKEMELKPLPAHLKYAYLGHGKQFPVIVSSELSDSQTAELITLLKSYREVIGYSITDMKGISPAVCSHIIYLEEGARPIREYQRRLKPTLQEVVKKEFQWINSRCRQYQNYLHRKMSRE